MSCSTTLRGLRGRVALLLLLPLFACATETATPDRRFIQGMRAWIEAPTRVEPFYRHIEDLLPNRRYLREDGSALRALSFRVVAGEFVGAKRGSGFLGTGKQVRYGDKDAVWNTVHADFRVDEYIAGRGPKHVMVGWPPSDGTDLGKTRAGLMSLGKAVLFLTSSAVYDYDKDVHAIVEDGAFLATVTNDGDLDLPFIRAPRSSVLLERVDTLSELRAEARKPSRTIQFQEHEGIIEPVP